MKKWNWNLILLMSFVTMWLYTEISEYIQREEFNTEVVSELEELKEFESIGPRFTAEDGAALEARVTALETLNDLRTQ